MRLAALVGLCLLLGASGVLAQAAPPPDTRAAYRELISKALQEYSLGHWSEARVFFSDAHAIWPNARTLRGLGMACYEARAYDESIGYLQQALDNPVQPLTAKLAAEARDLLEQAKRFVGRVVVEVEPHVGAVTIDSKPIETRTDGNVFVNPGEHQLDITASGYQPVHREFVVDSGQRLRLHVDLVSLSQRSPTRERESDDEESVALQVAPPPAEQPAQPAPTSRMVLANQQPAAAWVLSGLGLVAMGTGWAFYAVHDRARVSLWQHTILDDGDNYDPLVVQRYRTSEVVALATTAGGSLLFSLATFFWLPDDPGIPAWSIVLGTAGVALGVTALALALAVEHCDVSNRNPDCQRVIADRSFAPMIALQALPFLSVPIMYALRPRTNEAPQVALSAAWTDGPSVRLAGRF